MSDVVADSADQFHHVAKNPTPAAVGVWSRKKRSTMFSHDALVGVKWM